MSEDFSEYPVSLTETRAEQAGDGRLWTPRDALVSVLRDIDSGALKVGSLVVAFNTVDDEGKHKAFKYAASYRQEPEAMGIIHHVAYRFHTD